MVQKLNNELSEVKSNKIELSKHLMALDEDAKKLNVLYVESDRLQFEIQSNQESLKSITERQREIEITSRLDSINVKIADSANIPTKTFRTRLKEDCCTCCLFSINAVYWSSNWLRCNGQQGNEKLGHNKLT